MIALVSDSTSSGGQDFSRFDVVENPFLDRHQAAFGHGSVDASYDFAWSGNNGDFRIDSNLSDPDFGGVRFTTQSSGTIKFTTSDPILLELIGTFAYQLPVGAQAVAYGLNVRDATTNQLVFNYSRADDTWTHPPHDGLFTATGSSTLQAERPYTLQYLFRIESFGNTGNFGTADGFLSWTFRPVPEPISLGLLGLGAFGIASCRQRVRG